MHLHGLIVHLQFWLTATWIDSLMATNAYSKWFNISELELEKLDQALLDASRLEVTLNDESKCSFYVRKEACVLLSKSNSGHLPPSAILLSAFLVPILKIASSNHLISSSFNLRVFAIIKMLAFSILTVLVVAQEVHGLPYSVVQPDLHLAPTLPLNFSTKPSVWQHGTPLLRDEFMFENTQLARRQTAERWSGWQNVHYIFAL